MIVLLAKTQPSYSRSRSLKQAYRWEGCDIPIRTAATSVSLRWRHLALSGSERLNQWSSLGQGANDAGFLKSRVGQTGLKV